MIDVVDFIIGKNLFDEKIICNRSFDKNRSLVHVLDRTSTKIVEDDRIVPAQYEFFRDVCADETGTSCNER